MATTATSGFSIPTAIPAARVRSNRRRTVTPLAARALQILGHAIEYLTDDFVSQGLTYSSGTDQLEAVRILMALNRQVYNECPEIPSFGKCCRALLRSATA
ncbi:MAG: hypothetical protein ABSD72_17760 [Terracidiphilus sp.]